MTSIRIIEEILAEFDSSGSFKPAEITLSPDDLLVFVRMRVNPQRFLPRIFEGDWADPTRHPDSGCIRLLRVLKGSDGVTRAILRQGPALFAYPYV